MIVILIGPESDHWLSLPLTHSLTNSCLVDLIADVDDEDRVGNGLLQIWELKFCHKAKLLITRFGSDFEVEGKILKLVFG